jgi:hypothetical protein
MTLYRKHAQGETVKGDFTLSVENIDMYHRMSQKMDDEVRWTKTLINLRHKRDHPESITDNLYTPEYIARRIVKLEAMRPIDDDVREHLQVSQDLTEVEKELDIVKPLVFDKVEGQKAENHERMSDLNDRWNALQEQRNDIYSRKYGQLRDHLPKIYYMILEGVDMDTVNSCFNKMKSVLTGSLSAEDAANRLMTESETKYNLPKTIYDPIRMRGGTCAPP